LNPIGKGSRPSFSRKKKIHSIRLCRGAQISAGHYPSLGGKWLTREKLEEEKEKENGHQSLGHTGETDPSQEEMAGVFLKGSGAKCTREWQPRIRDPTKEGANLAVPL